MSKGNAKNISWHQSNESDCRNQILITLTKPIRFHRKAAARKLLLSAAMLFGIATVSHAEDASDAKTQSEQLRQQNQVLAKKLAALEQRLHKLEERPAKQAGAATPSAIPPNVTPVNYNKAPSSAAKDDSLTWMASLLTIRWVVRVHSL
jgi:hypothetical protein